jgi:hypothetical protein
MKVPVNVQIGQVELSAADGDIDRVPSGLQSRRFSDGGDEVVEDLALRGVRQLG